MSEEKLDPFQFERGVIERFLPSPLANISASYLAEKYDTVFVPEIPTIDESLIIIPITDDLFLYFQSGYGTRVYDINSWKYKEIEIVYHIASRSPYSNKVVIYGKTLDGKENQVLLLDGDSDIITIISKKMINEVTWLKDTEFILLTLDVGIDRERKHFELIGPDENRVFSIKHTATPTSIGILSLPNNSYHKDYDLVDPITMNKSETKIEKYSRYMGISWIGSDKIHSIKKDGSSITFELNPWKENSFDLAGEHLLLYSEDDDEKSTTTLCKTDGNSLRLGETTGDYLFLIDDDMIFIDREIGKIYTIDVNTGERKLPKRINDEIDQIDEILVLSTDFYIKKLTNNSIVVYILDDYKPMMLVFR